LISVSFGSAAAEKAGILGVRTRHVNESENQVPISLATGIPTRLAERLQYKGRSNEHGTIMKTFQVPGGFTFRRFTAATAAALLMMASLSASADEIYRWVDENGVVNYTQQKPRNTEAETIVTSSGTPRVANDNPAPTPVTSPSTGQPMSAEQEKMLEGLRAAERTRQQEIAKIKEQNCQQSRDVLSRLTLKDRIRVKGPDGEYTIMPEDERQERISKAQENIALFCVKA
jgi:hypothetical protein